MIIHHHIGFNIISIHHQANQLGKQFIGMRCIDFLQIVRIESHDMIYSLHNNRTVIKHPALTIYKGLAWHAVDLIEAIDKLHLLTFETYIGDTI